MMRVKHSATDVLGPRAAGFASFSVFFLTVEAGRNDIDPGLVWMIHTKKNTTSTLTLTAGVERQC